jgi:hypothetical protein
MSVTDFIAWVAGRNPDLKTIFASYSDSLGERTSLGLQRIFDQPNYKKIFGRTRVGLPGWKFTSDLIEYCDFRGSFRHTTSLGAVTGSGGGRRAGQRHLTPLSARQVIP